MQRKFSILIILTFCSVLSANSQTIIDELNAKTSLEDSIELIYTHLDNLPFNTNLDEVISDLQKFEFAFYNYQNDTLKALLFEKKGFYFNRNGEMGLAISSFSESAEYYKKAKDLKSVSRIYFMQSKIYLMSFDFEQSLFLCLKSLKLSDEIDYKEGQARAYMQIGITFDYQELYDEAIKYYKKALNQYIELDHAKGMSNGYNNIGVMFDYDDKPDSALYYYHKSMELDKQLGHSFGVAGSKVNIGLIYQIKGELIKTEKLYLEALNLYSGLENDFGRGICFINLADLYREKKEYKKAIIYVKKSIKLSFYLNDMQQLIDSYGIMISIYLETESYKESSIAQKDLMDLKDSIFNSEKKSEILELHHKYESQKKEKEINELSKQNTLSQLEISNTKNEELILFGGFSIVSLIAFFLFYQHRQTKKMNNDLLSSNDVLGLKNQIIQNKNQEITDSIQYAKKIQEALLPKTHFFESILPNSFVFYKPKDIVSGDFYWVKEIGNKVIFATVDCTGHGVPGAFMSIIGFNGLNKAIQEATEISSGGILNDLNKNVFEALHSKNEGVQVKDGMDVSLCVIDFENKKLEFSGARNSLYLVRNNELKIFKSDKKSIAEDENYSFETQEIDLLKKDSIYIFTDGFADQFGGEKGKKLNYSRFRGILLKSSKKPIKTQYKYLSSFLNEWKRKEEQVDDICIVGIKID